MASPLCSAAGRWEGSCRDRRPGQGGRRGGWGSGMTSGCLAVVCASFVIPSRCFKNFEEGNKKSHLSPGQTSLLSEDRLETSLTEPGRGWSWVGGGQGHVWRYLGSGATHPQGPSLLQTPATGVKTVLARGLAPNLGSTPLVVMWTTFFLLHFL